MLGDKKELALNDVLNQLKKPSNNNQVAQKDRLL
jgi:hypothetical protein